MESRSVLIKKRPCMMWFSLLVMLSTGCVSLSDISESGFHGLRMASSEVANTGDTSDAALSKQEFTDAALYAIVSAEIAFERGYIEFAGKSYLQALRLTKDHRIAAFAMRAGMMTKDYDTVIQAAQIWLELEPGNGHALRWLALVNLRLAKAQLAADYFEQMLAKAKVDEAEILIEMIAVLLGKEKDAQLALDVMAHILERRQTSLAANFAYSSLALNAGDLDLARKYTKITLEMNPNWSKGVVLNATLLNKEGKFKESEDLLTAALEKKPKHYLMGLSLARIYMTQKQFDKAQAQFLILLEQRPKDSEVWYALALLALQAKDLTGAKHYFTGLFSLANRQSESAYYLGQIEETEKNHVKAIEWYKQVRSDEYRLDAQLRIINLIAEIGNVDEVRSRLQDLRWKYPEMEVRFFLVEGEILNRVKQKEDAMKLYNAALAKYPNNHDLLYARGLLGQNMGFFDILEQDMLKVIKADPQHVDALNALGYTLADQTERHAEALTYIQSAYKLKPDAPAIMDSLGWVLYRLGKYEEALVSLNKAYELYKDAEIAAHLGEVLWMTGDKAKARKIWSESLLENPQHSYLLKVIKRLDGDVVIPKAGGQISSEVNKDSDAAQDKP